MTALDLAPPKNRLRKDGVIVSKNHILERTLDLLEIAPRTPTELAAELGYHRVHIHRAILKPLLEASKIKKVDGTDRYQLEIENYTSKTLKSNAITKSQFYNDCQTIKNWKDSTTSVNTDTEITSFCRLCLGLVTSDFKINPDNWRHPETTIEAIRAIRKKKGKQRLLWNVRQTLRHFIDLGLKHNLSKSEAKQLGIDGDKEAPTLASLEMLREQYDKVKKILKKENPSLYLKFGFSYWTSCRPSIRYTIKVDQLIFYDRKTEFVEINGKKFTSKEILEAIPILRPDIKVQSYTKRACKLTLHEFKTHTDFPKYIFDEEIVIALEKHVKQRKFQKKKYLFWDDSEVIFEFENYLKIVNRSLKNDNVDLTKTFFRVGFQKGDFGKTNKANYAVRHFSFQNWLQLTDYDFGVVTEMSHDDMTVLKKWYGKRSLAHLEQKMSEVIF